MCSWVERRAWGRARPAPGSSFAPTPSALQVRMMHDAVHLPKSEFRTREFSPAESDASFGLTSRGCRLGRGGWFVQTRGGPYDISRLTGKFSRSAM
jgi:hypothetical protein